MEIERINKIISLFDIYKNLLTSKQQQVISNYVLSNLSLSEIAEIDNTSRQAVKDLLDRTICLLFDYEEKLNILEKVNNSKQYVKQSDLQKFKQIWEG